MPREGGAYIYLHAILIAIVPLTVKIIRHENNIVDNATYIDNGKCL